MHAPNSANATCDVPIHLMRANQGEVSRSCEHSEKGALYCTAPHPCTSAARWSLQPPSPQHRWASPRPLKSRRSGNGRPPQREIEAPTTKRSPRPEESEENSEEEESQIVACPRVSTQIIACPRGSHCSVDCCVGRPQGIVSPSPQLASPPFIHIRIITLHRCQCSAPRNTNSIVVSSSGLANLASARLTGPCDRRKSKIKRDSWENAHE